MLEQVKEAFEVLSNPQQRKMYDQQLAQQKHFMQIMQGGSKQNKEKPKMQPTKKALDVTLEQLYKGGNVPMFH